MRIPCFYCCNYFASVADVRTHIVADDINNQPFSITITKELDERLIMFINYCMSLLTKDLRRPSVWNKTSIKRHNINVCSAYPFKHLIDVMPSEAPLMPVESFDTRRIAQGAIP
jgi:hypothetical protein